MKRVAAGLAAGAVWLLAAMPALGQQPQKTIDDLDEDQIEELYCVYDSLDTFGDRAGLTTAYMVGDPDAAEYKKQLAIVDDATADCNDRYKWADGRRDTASMIGLYGVMGDELESRLSAAGLKDADFDKLYDVYDAMSDDDVNAFVDGVWGGKQDVADRLIAAMAAKGIKGDAVVANAFYLAESYIIVSLLTLEWLAGMPTDS